MSNSPNLILPYIEAAQSQKHVTHNEAVRGLDAIVHLSVIDRDLATPPGSPADGARYLVASAPTGAWSGRAGKIAAWQDGAWAFYSPKEGWLMWVADEDVFVIYGGASFASPSLQNAPLLGVNAAADATNKFAVASDASLFNHNGAGHQQKINKNAGADSASQLYQVGFSGRAEIGLIGTDDFSFKVSADGSSFLTALLLDRATGQSKVLSGSAALPSVSFQGDPNTGMFSAGADVIGFSANGVERVRIGAAGISSAGLDVNARRFMATSADFADMITNINNTHSAPSTSTFNFQNNGVTRFNFGVTWTGADSPFYRINSSNSSGVFVGTPLRIDADAPTNALRISTAGNTGLGVSGAASARLQVNGAIRPASYTVAAVPSASANGAGAMIYVSNEAGGATIAFSDGTNWRRLSDRAVIS